MQTKNRGKIITIASTKGGVGKTITALNLAGVYSLLQKKVLIIDLDVFGGNIATYVNSTNEKTIFNVIEDFTNNRYEKMDDYIFKYNDNISCIAAPKDPRFASKIDGKYIPMILENVVYRYDVIIIDICHATNSLNVIALDNSDSVLYIFTNNSFDLKNTRTFMSIIKDIGMDNVYTLLNESINLEKGYYSMYDIRTIIKTNIDFTLPKSFHVKNIDKYIIDGKILTLDSKSGLLNGRDAKIFVSLAETLIADKKEVKE